jgi:SAM-dependent methyltransferase
MNDWQGGDLAQDTNEVFSALYDDFNYRYQNTQWTGRLSERAKAVGLNGTRLLDVACGTGLSAIPMLDRGWSVTACDISEKMIRIAKEKVGDRVRCEQADMRELPTFGSFDLVWAINDPLNYLLSEEELQAALVGMKRNLASEGVLLFDLNTLATYRTFFAEVCEVKARGRHIIWTGHTQPEAVRPGTCAEASVEEVGKPASAHVHRQRHYPEATVMETLQVAGLRCVEALGVSEPDGRLSTPIDEDDHRKMVYICKAM